MRLKLYRGKWAIVWTDEGRTLRRSLGTSDRDEAERRFADFRLGRSRAGEGGTVSDAVTAYVADLEARGKDPTRMRDAWKRLDGRFGALRPDQATKDVSRQYVAERRRQGASDGTIRTELGRLRTALRARDKHTPAIIELPPEPEPRARWLTREEYARLRDAARSDHIRLFIVLALATAARKGAILNLTWDRVHLDTGRINLGRRVGNKGRGVKPMTPEARAELEKAKTGATCEYVIEYGGDRVGSIDQAFRRTVGWAGIEPCGPHDIRRSAARWMAEAGVPMGEIAAYLDHTSTAVTEKVYAVFSPDYLADAARALEV